MDQQDLFLHIISHLTPFQFTPLKRLSRHHLHIINTHAYMQYIRDHVRFGDGVNGCRDGFDGRHYRLHFESEEAFFGCDAMQDPSTYSAISQQLAFSLSLLLSLFPNPLTVYYTKLGSPSDFDCYTLIFRDLKRVRRRVMSPSQQQGADHSPPASPSQQQTSDDYHTYDIVIPFDAYHSWTQASKLSLVSDDSLIDPSNMRSGDARRLKQRHLLRDKLQTDAVLREALSQIGREAHGQVVFNLKTMDVSQWRSFHISMDWGHFNRWKNRRMALVEQYKTPDGWSSWRMGFTMYGDVHSHMVALNGCCTVGNEEVSSDVGSGGTTARAMMGSGASRTSPSTTSRPSLMAPRPSRPSIMNGGRRDGASIMLSGTAAGNARAAAPPTSRQVESQQQQGNTPLRTAHHSTPLLRAQDTSPDDDVSLLRNEGILPSPDTHIRTTTNGTAPHSLHSMEQDAIDILMHTFQK